MSIVCESTNARISKDIMEKRTKGKLTLFILDSRLCLTPVFFRNGFIKD